MHRIQIEHEPTLSALPAELEVIDRALRSSHVVQVRRRIFRQLIESLIYEGIVAPELSADNEWMIFTLHGVDEAGGPVSYRCRGQRRLSFERIRLDSTPVCRIAAASQEAPEEATSLAQFLIEIRPLHNAPDDRLARFIGELEQTLLKDLLAQAHHERQPQELAELPYDQLEGRLLDGHPYHPSYKSRVGFDYLDNRAYGPEFAPRLRPIWLAARREWTQTATSASLDLDAFLGEQLGDRYRQFQQRLEDRGLEPANYVFLPVHPWQWREQMVATLHQDLHSGALVLLGESADEYQPQQSIRTLSNVSRPQQAYLKCALSIVNTSTSRILAPHTVQNAPIISDWLAEMVAGDPFLRDDLRVIVLREVAGIAYDRPQPPLLNTLTYGAASCIWRESLHGFLADGEQAMPWNGLTQRRQDGRPLIDPWVRRHGLEAWLAPALELSILPIIHLLYAHGVALESHAQNMVLVHRDGLPQRVAFKDFHDGVRFMPEHLAAPERQPRLHTTPARHWGVNRNSYVTATSPEDVRDFVLDAFLFINLAELALFLADEYGLSERQFWGMSSAIIDGYQQRFPHLQARFSLFDLRTPTIQVERLTNRRLFPETDVQIHRVGNPLAIIREHHA